MFEPGNGYLFSEESIKLDQLLISTQGSLVHSPVLLLQVATQLYTHIVPIAGICGDASPQAGGQPGYHHPLGSRANGPTALMLWPS